MESLNRWEKTIGLYRTASGVDISDGIFVATVPEHSPESYKPLPMCEHRTAQCVGGFVSMLRRCGDTTGPMDLLRTKPHQLDRCQWMSIRLVQCLDSRLARTGKGNRRERARTRMARTKAKAREVTRARIRSRCPNVINSKDTVGIATKGDTSVPTAENASPTPSREVVRHDGHVAAVMEVDDVVMRTGDDETSTGWCFCAVVGSTSSLLLDSGSDEHLCTLLSLQI